jgi:hypothetical protein
MIENNKAIAVRLGPIREHSNADKLKLVTIYGNQVIVGSDYKEGDLGVYFPVGVRLSEEFANKNDLIRRKDENGNSIGGLFENTCRVRCQKLRGEKSEGFFIPIKSVKYTGVTPPQGECFDTLNGREICRKYIPKRNPGATGKRALRGSTMYFAKHVDTAQIRMNYESISPGDLLVSTLKVHGTSQRIGHVLEERSGNRLQKLWWKLTNQEKEWVYLIGTRNVICGKESGKPFHSNEFRHRAAVPFLNNLHRNELVFYEVVGFENVDKHIMPGSDTDSLSKESRKKYGKRVEYTYGCENGQLDIYVYRIAMVNPDGILHDLCWDDVKARCNELGVKYCIELDRFIFDGDYEGLKEKVEAMTEGPDLISPNQPREGVVVRIDKNPIKVYKNKSWDFKELEGINPNSNIEDES